VRCVHCADAAPTDGLLGSNVYEVNQWLWQFGRGKPRLGGLTIKETSGRKDAVSNVLRQLVINRVLGIQDLDSMRACTLFLLLRRLSSEETVLTRLTHNLGCN
jgi:hypothetical protein